MMAAICIMQAHFNTIYIKANAQWIDIPYSLEHSETDDPENSYAIMNFIHLWVLNYHFQLLKPLYWITAPSQVWCPVHPVD